VEQLAIGTSSDLVDGLFPSAPIQASKVVATYRRVQVDEDGTRNMLSAAGLGEKGLERSTLGEILRIRVGSSVGQQTVLEEVPEVIASVADWYTEVCGFALTYSSQALLPSCVPAWPMWRWQIWSERC
jgi:hypothetical protein